MIQPDKTNALSQSDASLVRVLEDLIDNRLE